MKSPRGSALAAASVAILLSAGCGTDDGDQGAVSDRGGSQFIDVDRGANFTESPAPDRLEFYIPPEHRQGADFVAQSGCLACHRVGAHGNDGVGPTLTGVGERLSLLEIERALLNGPGIMPSYSDASREEIEAAARFIALLR